MTPGVRELLGVLKALGAAVSRRGDKIVVKAGQKPVPGLILTALRHHREEVLLLLADGEGDELVPRVWLVAQRQFEASIKLSDDLLPTERERLIADARQFTERWATEAARQGWMPADVFAWHPTRYDLKGLVALLDGRPLLTLARNRAVIRTGTGSVTFHNHRLSGDAARWQPLQ
jgi:hypothetical protein